MAASSRRAAASDAGVGFLNSASPETYGPQLAGFRRGLNEVGYTEGQNVAIEFRWAKSQYDRLPELAADLVRHKVAVIVATGGTVSAIAAKSVTTTIPIVFTSGGDPVRMGLVASLSRPGGNVTGVNLFTSTLAAKRLELLHELVPAAKVIAVLVNPTNPNSEPDMRAVEAAAPAIGVRVVVLKASNGAEIGKAFDALTQYKVDAVLVGADPLFNNSGRDQMIVLTARHAVPAIFDWRDVTVAGGLVSYGSSLAKDIVWLGFTQGEFSRVRNPPIYQFCSQLNLNSLSI